MRGILQHCRWQEMRLYIERKESERRYPLNSFNEMATLIRLSPLTANLVNLLTRDLTNIWDDTRAFSTSRLLRIYMSTLIALAIDGAPSFEPIRALQTALATRLRHFPAPEYRIRLKIESPGSIDNLEIMMFIALAREVADRAGFGDHTMYAHAPAPDESTNLQGLAFVEALFYQSHVNGALPRILLYRSGIGAPLPAVDIFRGKHDSPVRLDAAQRMLLFIDEAVATQRTLPRCREQLSAHFETSNSVLSQSPEALAIHKAAVYLTDLSFHLGIGPAERMELARNQLRARDMPISYPTAHVFCDLVELGEAISLR